MKISLSILIYSRQIQNKRNLKNKIVAILNCRMRFESKKKYTWNDGTSKTLNIAICWKLVKFNFFFFNFVRIYELWRKPFLGSNILSYYFLYRKWKKYIILSVFLFCFLIEYRVLCFTWTSRMFFFSRLIPYREKNERKWKYKKMYTENWI